MIKEEQTLLRKTSNRELIPVLEGIKKSVISPSTLDFLSYTLVLPLKLRGLLTVLHE